MAKTQKIKISDLQINTENYRYEPVSSQKEAIDLLIDEQKDKLYNLAEHIIIHGLNPNDMIQITPSNIDKTKYNVLEGNRRTVTLKLLNNPDLIDQNKHGILKKKFKKLQDDHKTKLVKEIDCILYDNPTEADKWIKLKHAGQIEGAGTVAWTSQQIQRFEEKVEGKSSIALQTIKLLQNSQDVPNVIKNNLPDLKITNLDRLLSDPAVREMLGVEINNGIIQSELNEKEVVKGLTQIVKDLVNPKFNVKKIYSKEDRKEYINTFPKNSKPLATEKAEKPWQFTANSNIAPVKQPVKKTKPNPKDRKKLIPKNPAIKISNSKVNSIYHELMDIDVTKHTNAVAVLFRVFIELSIDSYIEEHKVGNSSSLSSAKSGINFQQKMDIVVNHMDSKKFADTAICKGIKAAIKDKNDILGIDTWHAYVHNNRFSPKAPNLIITWDNMQDFMVILWNNIK
ncbi:MAG: hypothetical protein C0448_11975 [Sphingobacteriaceae bacterium]|nr:hypothetical protein [Sphingobacteriaceae bacterium]